MNYQPELMRRIYLTPYLPGKGPRYSLALYDCHRPHYGGPQHEVRAVLARNQDGQRTLLADFRFGCAPCDAIDSNACAHAAVDWACWLATSSDADPGELGASHSDWTESEADVLEYEASSRWGERY